MQIFAKSIAKTIANIRIFANFAKTNFVPFANFCKNFCKVDCKVLQKILSKNPLLQKLICKFAKNFAIKTSTFAKTFLQNAIKFAKIKRQIYPNFQLVFLFSSSILNYGQLRTYLCPESQRFAQTYFLRVPIVKFRHHRLFSFFRRLFRPQFSVRTYFY